MFIKSGLKPAIIRRDEQISYSDLKKYISGYARLFNSVNATKIAIFGENQPGWIYAFYAGWANSATVVPIDYLAPADDVAYILNDCRPEVIFYSAETAKTLNDALPKVDYQVFLFRVEADQHLPDQVEIAAIPCSNVDDTAVIIYTSGTTGSPKGVMLSFDNLLANIEAVTAGVPIFNGERNVLALLPYHHIFPLMGSMIAPLYAGTTIAMAPSMVSEDIIQTLQANKVAIMIGVPRLYAAIHKGVMDKINAHGLTRLIFKLASALQSRGFSRKIFKKVHDRFGGHVEYMVCGGAKLDETVAQGFKTLGFEMLEGFGMTEAAPMITFTRPGRWKIGSAGEALPGMEIRVVDGEITARGRNVMKGYFNRPGETAEVLKDGWLHTGDLGYVDKDGFIHITGRRKEIMVLSNGKNINPEEIETKLISMSERITEVGVFLKNDAIHAAILPNFRKLTDEGVLNLDEWFRWEIIDKYNAAAASYKKIQKYFLIREELPRTRLGKIQRFKLAMMDSMDSARGKKPVAHPEYEEYQVIRQFLMEQKQTEIYPDDHLEIDLGLDSLDKISFQTFLQSTFGVEIGDDTLLHHPTVEKIANFMKEKKQKITVEAVRWAEIFREKVDIHLPKSWFTQNLFKNTSRFAFRFYFRLRGEGVENIPDGPCILAPNHQSFFDGLFVSAFIRNKIMKRTYFYAKEKHIRAPWLKALASRNNVIIMDLNKDLKESLQKLAEILRKGKNIIIFPEGTRSRDGKIGSFKKAFAILSRELNVPIVPVSIKGAFEALPKGKILPRPWKKIDVKFHQPVFPGNQDYEAISEKVFRILAAEQAA